MNKLVEKTMKFLAGAGALNWGTSEFLDVNVLTYLPSGIISTLAVAAIAASGGFVIYLVWKKRI